MYSWVVHFLSYFISIFRERRRERESRGEGGIVVIELFYFFIFLMLIVSVYSFLPSSLLNARFRFHLIHPHLIIQCKVSFSSHSSSSHYSMQGFVFIIISSFWGGFIVNINKLYDFEMQALFSFPISE